MKSLPELMAMTDGQLNGVAAELDGWEFHPLEINSEQGCFGVWCKGGKQRSEELYCSSRDLAFELRKGFTDAQFKDWSFNPMTIIQLDLKDEPAIGYKSKFDRAYDDCSARYWTIAAVMVLQQGGV